MNNTNAHNLQLNYNNLASNMKIENSSAISKIAPWCNIVNVTSTVDLSDNYQDICQRHHSDNKWVLMINPVNDSLNYLSSIGKIDAKKILKVDSKKVNIDIKHIKTALLNGTCAAIILSDTHYNSAQIRELSHCAAQGKTQCIFLEKSTKQQQTHLH